MTDTRNTYAKSRRQQIENRVHENRPGSTRQVQENKKPFQTAAGLNPATMVVRSARRRGLTS